jgi:hypothetical protein
MEALCSSEASVDFQRISRRYVPEDRTLCNHRCENLNYESCKTYLISFLLLRKRNATPTTILQ